MLVSGSRTGTSQRLNVTRPQSARRPRAALPPAPDRGHRVVGRQEQAIGRIGDLQPIDGVPRVGAKAQWVFQTFRSRTTNGCRGVGHHPAQPAAEEVAAQPAEVDSESWSCASFPSNRTNGSVRMSTGSRLAVRAAARGRAQVDPRVGALASNRNP